MTDNNNQKNILRNVYKEGARCMDGSGSVLTHLYKTGEIIMATTGELRAIIEELQLVDIGEAASYLGEEIIVDEESIVPAQQTALSCIISVQQTTCTAPLCNCAI
jgi:hypothetical protein